MINFRYMQCSDEDRFVSGFALCYQDELEWDSIYKVNSKYAPDLMTSQLSVLFHSTKSGSYNLALVAHGIKQDYRVNIYGIDARYVRQLINNANNVSQFFLLSAKNIDYGNILINQHPPLYFREFEVNGKKFFCNSLLQYPYELVDDIIKQFKRE